MNKLIIPFLLITAFLAVGCSDDEPKDMVKEIRMQISSETGTYTPWGSEVSFECMLVKEDGESEYSPLPFGDIKGFEYVRGHEYYLSVQRTILANPPADASDRTYELICVLEDRLVADPEVPVDKEIKTEADIEYYDLCPFEKYAVCKIFTVDAEGKISDDTGSLPSYANVRI